MGLPGKEPGFVLVELFVITGILSSLDYKDDLDKEALSDYSIYYC